MKHQEVGNTSDDELGKAYYEKTNTGWPSQIPWNQLMYGTQQLWIARAKQQERKHNAMLLLQHHPEAF